MFSFFFFPSILEIAPRGLVSLQCHRSSTKVLDFIYTEGICGFNSLRKKLSYLIFFFLNFLQEMGKENLKDYCRKFNRKSTTEGLSPACLISSVSLSFSANQWKLCITLSTCFLSLNHEQQLCCSGFHGAALR